MSQSAICVGCDQYAADLPDYSDENPVESDGTYAENKFVCTACYVFLVDVGKDVGSPYEVQQAAIDLVRPLNNLT